MISAKRLLRLPVVTKSGTELGKVADVLVDEKTQIITQYEVRGRALTPFFGKTFLVAASQVIEITEERLIVEDGAVGAAEASLEASAV